MHLLVIFINILLLTSCSVPDLTDPATLSDAKKYAVDLKSLERKLMYSMFQLWVEEGDEPFTGWAKSTSPQNQLTELGYLVDGRKEGLWISWDENQTKISEIYWTEDRMDGPFTVWHTNGKIKVIGQTKDGEVDGKWTEFYTSGKLANRSLNQMGHLEKISVWHPDGLVCKKSMVIDGNGSFTRYLEDGRVEHVRSFTNGVEYSRKIFNYQ